MKQILISCAFLFSLNITHAQVFEVEKIKNAGDDDKRLNLVILSEGYQASEFADFKTDAESLVSDMFTQSPFLEYSNYFNVHIIKVPSNESGVDHPGTGTDVTEPYSIPITDVDTYFNATFDAWGFHRFLYYGLNYTDVNTIDADAKINSVLASNFPTYDQALILVNTDEHGGTGGEFPISSTGASGNETAIHELGHSLFDLRDEYFQGEVYAREAANMTQETDPSLIIWKNWINTNSIGIYQHTNLYTNELVDWYKPHEACKMGALWQPFCSVCKETMIEKIHSLISPIASYNPASSSVSNPSFPLDFQLNLIEPNPNTLESVWTLNASNFANDVSDISILETNLNVGTNTLVAVVHDATTFVDVDNHDSLHIYTVTWTIENSGLGIETIKSEANNLSITLFPNPSNTFVNFKIESDNDANLRIDLITIDGKKVKTISMSNYETQQVDISNLSHGIYLANIYADNIWVTSKKLVKK
ncbi:MAG: M64 family metallopeptidase [Algibacter sp.]